MNLKLLHSLRLLLTIFTIVLFSNLSVGQVTINMGAAGQPTVTNAASGTLYDDGGVAGNYMNSANYELLIQVPGADSITLTFTSYNTEANWDYFQVYQGTNATGTHLTDGTIPPSSLGSNFSGFGPGLNGTLTAPFFYRVVGNSMYVRFRSDGSVNAAGWVANWVAHRPRGNNDVGAVAIDSPGTTFCSGSYPVYARIRNFGFNPVTSFNVNWTLDGVAQTQAYFSGNLDTLEETSVLLGNTLFNPGVARQIVAWTSLPNGVTDTLRNNDTIKRTGLAAISGTFTVGGAGANYATIDAAIAALNQGGVCGPVVFNINPGTYTRTTPIVLNDINGASNINTITFNGGNANTTIFTGAVSSSSMFLLNASKYVTIQNITFTNTSATAPGGIGIIGASRKVTIRNCKINIPVQTGTSTTGYGIAATGTASGVGVSACAADSLVIDSNTINGGAYSIVAYGVSNVASNRGIIITNNTVTNCNYMGGYIAYNYNPIICTGNTFNMIGGTYGYYGLYYYYNYSTHPTIGHNISNNRINNFGGYGMYLYYTQQNAATAKASVYNNIVTSASSGTYYGYYGIYVGNPSGAIPIEVFHNTVAMNGTSTSTSYSAFYNTGSTGIAVKNNIFAVYGGSYTPAYFATSPNAGLVNFNLYWNSSNVTTGSLVYRNATFYNPSNYKTAANGGDSSYNSNPSFIARLPLPGNLKLLDGCDGYGTDLSSSVPFDFEGTPRSVTPNLGAYEFVGGVNNNLAVLGILSPVAPISTGLQDLRFLVKNIGANTVSSYNASYSLNNGTPVTIAMMNTLATCATDTPTFTGLNQINMGPSNQITYYTDGPNSQLDADRVNDTARVSFFAPLNGTYTVGGTNPDFPNVIAAASALQYGVAGPVVFEVRPGTYTGQVIIQGPIPGLNSTNNVTFEGTDATNRIIAATVSGGPVVSLRNVSFIRFRNLTINNTVALGSNCAGIGVLGSNATSDGSGVQIVKCRINLPIITTGTTTNGWAINFSNQLAATGVGAMGADSILIDSNIITGGAYGIAIYGASNVNMNRGIVVTNNIVNNNNYMGGYIAYNYNPIVVTGNTFNMQGQNYGYYGLYFYYNYATNSNQGHLIAHNKVYNFGGYGMYLYYPMQNASTAKMLVYNNLVSSFNSGSYYGYYGINVGSPSGAIPMDIFHNTIVMNGPSTSTTYSAFYSSGTTGINIKNNIFVTNAGSYTPMYLAANPATGNVNYNLYYNAANPLTGNLIYRNATFYNPANYKTVANGGDSSWNFVPPFVSNTDLRLNNGCTRGVDLTATVPTDIDGLSRSTTPNPGAYEYPGVSLDITPQAILEPTFPVALGTQDLRVLVRNNGSTTVTSFDIAYRLNNGTPVSTSFFGNLASCDTVSIVFTGLQAINLINQSNSIRVYTYNVNAGLDLNSANDTLNQQLSTPLTGNYVIGNAPSDFTTFTAAIDALKLRGASGTVVFNVKTGVYNEQLDLTNYPGSQIPTTMVWFQSQAGNRDSVRLQWNSSLGGGNYVVRFNGVNRIGLRNIWTAQLAGNVTCYNLLYVGDNNSDSVENCRISVPVYGVNGTSSTYTIYISGGTGRSLSWSNNRIVGSYYGNYIFGVSATPFEYLNFSGNTIDSIAYAPFYYLYYGRFTKINNNTFNQPNLGFTCYNYWYYLDSSTQMLNNRFNINSTGYYHYIYYWRNTAGYKSIIANNVFTSSTTTATCWLYWSGYSQNMGIYHNSFSTHNTSGYAPYFYNISSTNIDVANNVCANNSTASPSAAGIYQNVGLTMNNNAFFSANANNLIYRGTPTATYNTLAAYRAANIGLDSNSIVYRPGFTSVNNLVPNASDSASWSLNARGKFTEIATDFNGNPRSQTLTTGAPDIGAYEFTPTSTPPLCTPVPATPVAGTSQTFLFGQDTVCTIDYDAFALAPPSLSVRQYTGTTPPMVGTATATPTFYISADAPVGLYGYTMNLRYHNNWIGTIGSEFDIKLAQKTAAAPWLVHQFTSTTDSARNIVTNALLNEFGLFTIGDNLNPLPVKLNAFEGVKENNDAYLVWTTASEKNSSHFVVERSVNGEQFNAIGKLSAKGNSKIVTAYNFNDAGVFTSDDVTVAYYRLKMVDMDGSSEYSKTIAIRNASAERASVNAYPNPFLNSTTIMVSEIGNHTVEVVDITGKVVFVKTVAAANVITLDEISNLKPGVYFARVNHKDTVKLIKQ